MQNRYTGDLGDFGKLGLLRWLRQAGLSVGLNWYLTPDETHNRDGRHVDYLKNDEFSSCDQQLWTLLGQIVDSGQRQVSQMERPDILDAVFYSQMLDFRDANKPLRTARRYHWHQLALETLRGQDVICVDPDNGLMTPSAEGTRRSCKYVLPQELADYYRAGASVIYYQHKGRQMDAFYMDQNRRLLDSGLFPDAAGLGLKFKTTSQRYYFFLLQPRHSSAVIECVERILETSWGEHFTIVSRLVR